MEKPTLTLIRIVMMLALALTGCAKDEGKAIHQTPAPDQTTTGPKVLKLNMRKAPPSADPGRAEDTTSSVVVRATFDGLTRMDKDGKIIHSVAEKIDVSPDQKSYLFHLRDTKWSNGDPVTARDFEFAWKRVLDPKTAASMAYQLYHIKGAEAFNSGQGKSDDVGIKAVDDRTLQVDLEYPAPFFLELTAFYTYYPVNQKIVEASDDWAVQAATHVGNGPFKMEEWKQHSRFVFVKNAEYWDRDQVKIDRIEMSMVEGANTELSLFENRELDWSGQPFGSLPSEALQALQDSGKLITAPSVGTYMFKFNTRKPPFDNANIRKAFAYAINRKDIADNILQMEQDPALGIVPSAVGIKPGGYFTDNDQALAKELLAAGMAELGISALPPITFSFDINEKNKQIAEAVQDQWKRVLGVEVKLENQEWKVYVDKIHQGNYQIGRMGWMGDYMDAVNFLEIFKDRDGLNNETGWGNDRFRELIDQSRFVADEAQRKSLLVEAEQILMDEMPVTPIYYYADTYVANPSLKDVTLDGLGNIDFKWADKE